MGDLTLLNPWLLAGLAGASLPILIHLIGRRRAPTVRFAAFDFLMAVNKRLARRERLRQILLLLLRTLAVAALVFAVARPMPPRAVAATASSRSLALVIDASASMAYELSGDSLLELAKVKAKRVISNLQPGDSVSLVIASREVRAAFQAPSIDHSAVRAAIDAIDEPAGTADLGTAIDNALAQLGDDGSGVTLAIIGDLSQNSFEQLRPTVMEPAPEVRLIDVAERDDPAPLPNLAIERVTVGRSGGSASERTIQALVRNFGGAAVERKPIELVINGSVTHRAFVSIPARGSEEKVLTHNFEGPGVYRGQVRFEADTDGFAADDAAHFVAAISRGVRVLAINGDPRTTPYEDELFFLERALEAVPAGDPAIDLRMVSADELLDGELELTGYDVILLANVAVLPPELTRRVRSFLQNGGGVLFALGDRINFEKANDHYEGLLAHPLRDLTRVADPDAGTPPVGMGELDWDHPILHGLDRAAEDSLRASRTASYFNLDVGAGLKARTVLRFANGAPALVEEKRDGKGRLLMLTTSLDVDMSDLALRTAFPALVQRTVRYLADALDAGGSSGTTRGGQVEIPAPTGAIGVALVSPSGERRAVALDSGENRAVFSGANEVGVHAVQIQTTEWHPEPRLDVAVNPSLEESDFFPISAARISEALGNESDAESISVMVGAGAGGDPFESRGYASYLLLALGLMFVGESLLASRG